MSVQKMDRFEVLNELGKGSQGAVYLAHDPRLDRAMLRRPHSQASHIVSRLKHLNRVALYDGVYARADGRTLQQVCAIQAQLS